MTRTIDYDDRRHAYVRAADGVTLPSATGLLRWGGLVPESARQHFAAPYLARGKRVHRATALYDASTDRLTALPHALEMVHTAEEPYVLAWAEATLHLDPRWTGVEVLRSFRGLVAGTIDRTGILRRMSSVPYVIADLKTGPPQKWHRVQLALYALMDEHPLALRLGVHLHKDGTFHVERYDDPRDFTVAHGLIRDYWESRPDDCHETSDPAEALV